MNFTEDSNMLGTVKIDKLCFGISNTVTPDIATNVNNVIRKYYGNVIHQDKSQNYKKLHRSVTPTKQLRDNYEGYNHNLQMIPLDKFCEFLKKIIIVAGRDLDVYELHLAKDILVQNATNTYLETLKNHEYLNGYIATTNEANSQNTVYISKAKKLSSSRKQKLLIKFYDKAAELMNRMPQNRVLPIKEEVQNSELPMSVVSGKKVIHLYNINLLRCELELRENNLPYTTIKQMIEAIENGSFQDTIEAKYNKVLSKIVLATSKTTSCKTLKEIAITLMKKSNRNYKTLFKNSGMAREYNYFKKAKEVVTREDDLNFEELRNKLITKSGS